MKLRTLTLIVALVLPTLTTGCFGILGSRGPEESATITVLNDMDPAATMTILIRRDGDEETLGTVPAGAERSLNYESRNLQGAHQLVARQTSAAEVVSREFTLFGGAQVRWQLRANSMTVSQ